MRVIYKISLSESLIPETAGTVPLWRKKPGFTLILKRQSVNLFRRQKWNKWVKKRVLAC